MRYPKLDSTDQPTTCKAIAPGKVIISGEHSVVYGQPALATTVDLLASATASLTDDAGLAFHLQDFALSSQLSWEDASLMAAELQARYEAFLAGDCPITDVAQSAEQLVVYAVMQSIGKQQPHQGMKINVQSQIPVGSGMGSSAAIASAVLAAVNQLVGQPLSIPQLQRQVHQVENLQHGRSSGLDPATICQGGLLSWQQGEGVRLSIDASPTNASNPGTWYWVNSGKPSCSTGECVQAVADGWCDNDIWSDFAAVTAQMTEGLQRCDNQLIVAAIVENQRLLTTIGVVPVSIQQTLLKLHEQGFAAKISGAGAIRGDAAGLILIYSPSGETPPTVFGQQPQPLPFYSRGVECDEFTVV